MATKSKLLQAAAGTAAASGGGGAVSGLNVEDVFSTYLYDGIGGNQVIKNGISLGPPIDTGGSILVSSSSGSHLVSPQSSQFAFGTGDFTIEAWIYPNSLTSTLGVVCTRIDATGATNQVFFGHDGTSLLYYSGIGATGGTIQANVWSHIACSRQSGTVRIFLNGYQVGSVTDTASKDTQYGYVGNGDGGGSQNFNGYISNARFVKGTAVYTSDFTPSTSALTAISGTSLLTCQGASPFADNSSNNFTMTQVSSPSAETLGPFPSTTETGDGGMVWTKDRVNGGSSIYHHIMDTEATGLNKTLWPNDTSALYSSYGASSWNGDGYTVNMSGSAGLNNTSGDYVSWTWKKQPKFFDIQTFTVPSAGTDQTISHSLDTTVGFVITKLTSSASGWYAFHTSRPNKYLTLNTNSAEGSWTWSSDSTEIDIGAFWSTAYAGETGVAYFFAHNDGDANFGSTEDQDIIKCGSYTGNGSTDGPEIDLGFEPQLVLLKVTSQTSNWLIFDNMRGIFSGGNDAILYPDENYAEAAPAPILDLLPTGFKLTSSSASVNGSGGNYIYMAIRRGPMAVPTSGTEVFDTVTYSSGYNTSFTPDVSMLYYTPGYDDGTNAYPEIFDRLRGSGGLQPPNIRVENTGRGGTWDHMTKFDGVFGTGAWQWKRAPHFADVIAYKGDGVSSIVLDHNLAKIPELIIFKARDRDAEWKVWSGSNLGGASYFLALDSAATVQQQSSGADIVYNISTTSMEVKKAIDGTTAGRLNDLGYNYVAYLFSSLDGVSKIGTYTGNGSTQNIDCGFSNGARFVLIKGIDYGTNWYVFDTHRGIVAGNDSEAYLDLSVAIVTNRDLIDPYSAGFSMTGNGVTNTSGQTYLFFAIA
jgi:hypothetical protein